ncbi:unnamed protein product [Lampetra fluviatilis]
MLPPSTLLPPPLNAERVGLAIQRARVDPRSRRRWPERSTLRCLYPPSSANGRSAADPGAACVGGIAHLLQDARAGVEEVGECPLVEVIPPGVAYLDEPLLWTRCGDDEGMPPGTPRCVSSSIVEWDRDANSFAILVNGTLPGGEAARPSLLLITPLEKISPSAPRGLRASVLSPSSLVFVWDPPSSTRLLSFVKYRARLVTPRAGREPQVLADTLIEKRTALDLVVDPGLPYRVSVRAIPIYSENLSSPWSHLDYSREALVHAGTCVSVHLQSRTPVYLRVHCRRRQSFGVRG